MSRDAAQRIVCLTEEPTEILYRLGEEHRIVGISAYTVRPPHAKETKPVVSAFVSGSIDKIRALNPDLVIGFSDVQADFARDLLKAGLPVLIFNQRTLAEILDVVLLIGRLVGAEAKAITLVEALEHRLAAVRERTQRRTHRPRVYFEEWDDPQLTTIRWVSELIEAAGGDDVFSDRSHGKSAAERTVTTAELLQRAPDVYIGCWCGKPVDLDSVRQREGWDALPFIRHDRLHEIDPAIILQPGPACITDGLDALVRILDTA